MTITNRVVYNNFSAIAKELAVAASEIVRETAFEIVADIGQGMSGAHGGEVYGNHRASAPGEMPAIDTGDLASSIQVEAQPGAITAYVYSDSDHAQYMEFGAPNAGISPRPFMAPSAERATPKFVEKMSHLEGKLASGSVHR